MSRRYSAIAKNYASKVIDGTIPAGKYIKLSCSQFHDDLNAKKSLYYYDNKAAAKACQFVELQFHTKGEWARKKKKLILESWQIYFVCNIFGWKRNKNDLRRYNEVLLLVPRKNGKSQLAAAIGLYMLCADGEHGAEVYSGATSEKQAGEVFIPAQIMARTNPQLVDHFGVDVRASNINIPKTGSKFERIIGNPGDGSSPSCAIVDEYHEHSDDRMYDTMQTGMGARSQPLLLSITTAGDNLAGPCYALQLEAQKILEGSIENDRLFALIYTVDSGDDWASIDTLRKANPNFGVSVSEDFLLARLADAKNNARKQSVYKTKHLNVWVGSREAYFNVERWKEAEDVTLKLEDFKGMRAYIGLDLASKVDVAALEILIRLDDEISVRFGKYYLPEAAIDGAANSHYSTWAKEGYITITDGEIIDFNEIKDDILELSSMFEVVELAYDPFQATMLVTELMSEGVPVVEVRPTVLNFSEPMKQMDGLIRSRKILHNGDPVFTWMLSNVVAKSDAKDNVYPRKERDENKIDGAVAHMMALSRSMNDDSASLDSFLNNPISVNF
jgi:phage terminase large subunit-like protein